ncbi:MAG: hypothetical protein AAF799_34420 [Myxococcota bacterium]
MDPFPYQSKVETKPKPGNKPNGKGDENRQRNKRKRNRKKNKNQNNLSKSKSSITTTKCKNKQRLTVHVSPSPHALTFEDDDSVVAEIKAITTPKKVKSIKWSFVTNPIGAKFIKSKGNTARIESEESGTVKVRVEAKTEDQTAVATSDVHFVDVYLPEVVAKVLPPQEKEATRSIQFEAEGTPNDGTYAWEDLAETSGDVAISGQQNKKKLKLQAKTPGTAQVEVAFTPSVADELTANITSTAAFFRIEPAVQAVKGAGARSSGKLVTMEVKGTPDAGTRKWSLSNNTIGATIEGGTNGTKLKIRSKKSGVVKVKFQYTPPEAKQPLTSHGAAVFVACPITKFKAGAATAYTDIPTSRRKPIELLIDHSPTGTKKDPAAFKTGRLLVEADPKPTSIQSTGLDDELGTYEWSKPANNKFIRISATQPNQHGRDQSKVAIDALPKTGTVGPTNDYAVEKVQIKRKLHNVPVTDTIDVHVHKKGCSQVKWRRARLNNVTSEDRLKVCKHAANPQWDNWALNMTEPPGGIPAVASNGHQHGGPCGQCSSDARTIWHYVESHNDVITHAKDLANTIATFTSREDSNSVSFQNAHGTTLHGNTLFTNEMWATFRPQYYDNGSSTYRYRTRGRMLGVLRGKPLNSNAWQWIYGLSGEGNHGGTWAAEVDVQSQGGDTSRAISGYLVNARYGQTSGVFNTNAMTSSWTRFGRCAATRVLRAAIAANLCDIQLAEVWVYPGGNDLYGNYDHGYEIGSCEQCRRYLGLMLCETGVRT